MLALTIALLVSAEVADAAIALPANEQVPFSGEADVPLNSSLVLRRFPAPRAVRLVEGDTETNLVLETAVQGVTVARLPEQAANSDVHVVIAEDFDNDGVDDFTEDITWTTGARRVEGDHAPVLVDARAEHPLFESQRAVFEVEPDADRAVLALFRVDDQGIRTLVNAQFGTTSLIDFSYAGGVQEYLLVGIDRAGNVSEATDATLGAGGCNAAGAAAPLWLLLAALLRRRR